MTREAKLENDIKIKKLCKDIGSDFAIQTFKKQLWRCNSLIKKQVRDELKQRYIADKQRLLYAIDKAKELDIKYDNTELKKQSDVLIKKEQYPFPAHTIN